MENTDVEKHHIIFAIVSVIISIIVTLLVQSALTLSSTPAWITILIDYIFLILSVKIGSILLTILFFNAVNGKKSYKPKTPLGFADFDLSASMIITGVIFLEYYNYAVLYAPWITSDYIYPLVLILMLIPSTFMVTYGIMKNIYS